MKNLQLSRSACWALAVAAAGGVAACSSVPPPTEQMAVGKSAIDSAQTAGAPEFAAGELAQARTKYEQAEAAMKREDFMQARRLAEAASVDAQLAQARASSAREQAAAAQIDQSIRALRSEINRAAPVK